MEFPKGADMKLQEAFYPFGAHYGLVFSNNIQRGGPPENSKILAERIPHARLRVIEGGGHQFLIEQPDDFNNAVLEFLLALPKES